MALLTIPLSPDLKSFRQRTELDGSEYVLVFQYNQRLARWFMDVLAEDDSPLISGVLVAPVTDLSRRRAYNPEHPPGALVVLDLEAPGENGFQIVQGSVDPSRNDLGTRHALTYTSVT